MYQDFYKLTAKPFSLLPDPDFLFRSRKHGRAANHLEYGSMTEAGFVVITGDVGAGKTTVVRHFLKSVDDNSVVGLINAGAPGGLLGWIAAAFDLERGARDTVQLYELFTGFLISQHAIGKRAVLIVDEAQNLSRDMLEELRVLSNVNYGKDQLLQIVLVGQPELLETLKQPDMQQFKQRIAVHCHLDPLSPKETSLYIRHRLAVAGGTPKLFDKDALVAVHYYSGGVPRLINLLCDQALTYAFSDDRNAVTSETVAEVVADRTVGGLSPFNNSDVPWSEAKGSDAVGAIRKEMSATARTPKS